MELNFQSKRFTIRYQEACSQSDGILSHHCHDRYELLFITHGKTGIVLQDRKYLLSEGELCVIPPYLYHNIELLTGYPYTRVIITCGADMLPAGIRPALIQRLSVPDILTNAAAAEIMHRITDSLRCHIGAEFEGLYDAQLTELLYAVWLHHASEPPREVSLHPTTCATLRYLDCHLSEHISLAEVAAAVYSSPSTVSHLFQRDMHISVLQYILQRKMAQARKLLEGGTPATEVAVLVGYRDYSAFYRAYRKVMGTTPKSN